MYELFVGDNNVELSIKALKYDQNARLLDSNVYKNKSLSGTYYTSLADFDIIENFFDACVNSSKIFYYPPDVWSDLDKNNNTKAKQWTENILYYCNQFIEVINLNTTNKKFLEHFTKKDRKTSSVQMWVAGCSYTEAVGVNHDQTWKEHVRKKLNLEYIDFSKRGTSISWAASHLLRSDIRKDDIVLWQLTGCHRNFVIHDNTENLYHLLPSDFDNSETNHIIEIKKTFPIEYIDSKTTIYKNILSVQQVYNFCKKVQAKLVILGTLYDWDNNYLHYNVPCFEQAIVWPMRLVDTGTDNLHPGPEQHKIYAKRFIELLQKHYKDIPS